MTIHLNHSIQPNTAMDDHAPSGTLSREAVGDLLQNAAQMFDKEPCKYALRPSCRKVLEAAINNIINPGAVVESFTDIQYYREGEALYVLRTMALGAERVLEASSFGLKDNLRAVQAAAAKAAAAAGGKTTIDTTLETPAANGPGGAAAKQDELPFQGRYVKDTLIALQTTASALKAYMSWRDAELAAAGKLISRLERLMQRLDLSPRECELFRYIFFSQTSQEDLYNNGIPGLSRQSRMPPTLYADLSTQDFMAFLSPERRHIKDALVPDCSKMLMTGADTVLYGPMSRYSGAGLSLSLELIKVLMGQSLSEEELLKVDKTVVMEVLSEEPGFLSSTRMMQQHAHEPDASAQPSALGVNSLAGPSEDLDLYELIKVEVKRDLGISGLRAVMAHSHPHDEHPAARQGKKRSREEEAKDTSIEAPGDMGDSRAEDLDSTLADDHVNKQLKLSVPASSSPSMPAGELREYRNDLEYLEDCFKLLMTQLQLNRHRRVLSLSEEDKHHMVDDEDYFLDRARGNPKARAGQQVRELEGRERLERSRIELRLRLTAQARSDSGMPWKPRLERLCEARQLVPFEKNVLLLLVGCRVSPSVARTLASAVSSGYFMGGGGGGTTVGNLLLAFFPTSLQEQISGRKYFYKSGQLVKDGIITLTGIDFSKDIMEQGVDIDRRMLDFLVGLDTEFSDMVDGSHLYFPQYVSLPDVVLPAEQKQLIVETVETFSKFKKVRSSLGVEGSAPGSGLVMLFHGASGVGKTMMANAVARHVGKKVLLINFPSLGVTEAGQVMQFIFREAKINDALLFFDECESIFEDRDRGSRHVNMLLTEIERYDGIVIMATNRPHDIDEAMYRRITMAFEFRRPDHLQRLEIWKKQIPAKVQLGDDVDLPALAIKYELSGGYIKNAVQAALCKATARELPADGVPVLTQADLLHGAQLQLRGALRMKDSDRRKVPRRGLEAVLLPNDLKGKLEKVVQHEKARAVLVGQWGFGQHGDLSGTICMFYGPPGTGKTLAAEAIGFETGRPLKVVNCSGLVSKWVGDTPKNIDALFEEARALDCVLVFDEAEGLFGARSAEMSSSTDRYAAMDVGVLLYHLETHTGIVILITNKPESIDKAFHRRIRFMEHFKMPDAGLRAKLWRSAIPQQTPVADDVNWTTLAERYELAGGSIKNVVVRAATRAALRMHTGQGRISMADLVEEAQEEVNRMDGGSKEQAMAMYL